MKAVVPAVERYSWGSFHDESQWEAGTTGESTATAVRSGKVDSIVGSNQVGHTVPFIDPSVGITGAGLPALR